MKRILSLFLLLACAAPSVAFGQAQQIAQSQTAQNLKFGPIVSSANGKTAVTGLLSGATLTATGGSTTTITSATAAVVGQQAAGATGTAGNIGAKTWVTAVSGTGPYTMTVSPALPNAPANTDTFTLSNFTLVISKNGGAFAPPSGTVSEVGRGYYIIAGNATDSASQGPVIISWDASLGGGNINETTVYVLGYNPYDGVRLGLTAIPNATAGANTGLPVVGTQVPNATAGAANGLFIAGTNAATSITTGLTANITGNLSGSVGSVTGAVGSVTGNVGGNVTGTTGDATNITAIKTQTDKLLFDGSNFVKSNTNAYTPSGGAATLLGATFAFPNATVGTSVYAGADTSGTTTLLSRIPGTVQPQTGDSYARLGAPAGASIAADIATRSTFAAGGNVTVNAYAAGQDPATLVLGATVDSGGGFTLTVKQSLFLSFVQSMGKFGTPTRSTSAPWTITVPYLRLDGTTTGWTYVTTYTDNTFTKTVSRTFTPGTLP